MGDDMELLKECFDLFFFYNWLKLLKINISTGYEEGGLIFYEPIA